MCDIQQGDATFVRSTLLDDAVIPPEELTIDDWAEEMYTVIEDTLYSQGEVALERFNAITHLVTPTPYAAYPDGKTTVVIAATSRWEVLLEQVGLSSTNTVAELIQALERDG